MERRHARFITVDVGCNYTRRLACRGSWQLARVSRVGDIDHGKLLWATLLASDAQGTGGRQSLGLSADRAIWPGAFPWCHGVDVPGAFACCRLLLTSSNFWGQVMLPPALKVWHHWLGPRPRTIVTQTGTWIWRRWRAKSPGAVRGFERHFDSPYWRGARASAGSAVPSNSDTGCEFGSHLTGAG